MKCASCGREWTVANSGTVCPYCGKDGKLPSREVDRMKNEAMMALSNRKYIEAATLLHDVAEQGDAQAEYHYAVLLLEGKGIKASPPKAAVYLKQSARRGYYQASVKLSEVLLQMSLPESTCLFWFRVSAMQGNPEAQYKLAKCYEKGTDGFPVCLPRALYWYLQSSDNGYEEATLDLIRYYTEDGTELSKANARYLIEKVRGHRILTAIYTKKLGKGEKMLPAYNKTEAGQDLCELGNIADEQSEEMIAAAAYRQASALGNAEGKYRYGMCLEAGSGTEKNVKEAASFYKAAADAGYSPAMTRLGLLLRNTDGEGISSAVAMSWIQRAANAGEADAAYAMGCAYFGGTLTERNLILARKWFGIAAEGGHEDAKKRASELDDVMNELYRRGEEAKEANRAEEAYRLYQMAADMGHTDARCSVGTCYQTGYGTKKDGAQAVKYYTLAAENGNTAALFNLGLCYFNGDGVPCDYRTAKTILEKAAKLGFEEESTAMIAEMENRKRKKLAQRLYATSAVIYHRGDVDNAIRFRTIAAKLGHARAMYLLGCHYEYGDGLPFDHVNADQWFRQATAAGFHAGTSRIKNGFMRMRKHRMAHKRYK